MVFQTFVFMQLFNQINARKLGAREFNVFAGFFNNGLFLGIVILTFVIQISLVQYGGVSVRCAPLHTTQNLWCAMFGAGELLWALVIKSTMPTTWFDRFAMNEKPKTDFGESGLLASFRRSFRQSVQDRIAE